MQQQTIQIPNQPKAQTKDPPAKNYYIPPYNTAKNMQMLLSYRFPRIMAVFSISSIEPLKKLKKCFGSFPSNHGATCLIETVRFLPLFATYLTISTCPVL
jgi:hypothetical protein